MDQQQLQTNPNTKYALTVEQLIEALSSLENNDESKAYLDFLQNEFQSENYFYREQLLQEIENKRNSFGNTEVNNEEELSKLQEKDPEFFKLNIIKTSKLNNDSHLDIEYITFTDETGKSMMLETSNATSLKEFIEEKKDSNYTAKDVFEYFKSKKYREVEYFNPDRMQDQSPEQFNRAVKNNDTDRAIEREKVEEYCKDHQINLPIEVGVDFQGERIYRVGETIIKFEQKGENRNLVPLQTPEQLRERERMVQTEKEQGKDDVADTKYSFNSIETSNPDHMDHLADDVTPEMFNDLIIKAFDFHEDLSGEEMLKVTAYVEFLLNGMNERIENNQLEDQEQMMLDGYMERVAPLYEDYHTGVESTFHLSDQQIQQIEAYIQLNTKKEEFKRQYANKPKSLTLTPPTSTGIANYLIIAELCALASLILLFMANK